LATKRAEKQALMELLEEERRSKAAFLANCYAMISSIENKIQDSIHKEEHYVDPITDTRSCISTLRMIETDREAVIRKLDEDCKRLDQISQAKDAELLSIKEKTRREFPVFKAKKDDEILQIKDAWEREKKQLMKEYDRLQNLNREMRFHLHRGTPVKDHLKDERDYAYLKFYDEKVELQQEVKQLNADVKLRLQMKQDLVNKFQHQSITAERNRGDYEDQSKLLERQLKETKEQTGQLVEEIEKYRELIKQRNEDVGRYEAAQSKLKEQTKSHITGPRKIRDAREAILQP